MAPVKVNILKILDLLRRNWLAILLWSIDGVAVVILVLLILALLPQTIHYSYAAGESCVLSPKILPGLFRTEPQTTFRLTRPSTITLGHTPLYSEHLCTSAVRAPKSDATYTNHEGLFSGESLFASTVSILTSNYPQLLSATLASKPIALTEPMALKLNQSDQTFSYAIAANNSTSLCITQNSELSCELQPLHLKYGHSYKAAVVRLFDNQPVGDIDSQNIQTITATTITKSSIAANSVVYNKPKQIVLHTDKALTDMQGLSLVVKEPHGKTTTRATTSSFSGDTIKVAIAHPLPRKAKLELHIDSLTAADHSTLAAPYNLNFTTSGGPAVTGINIPSYGLTSGQTIVVYFSQSLESHQNPSQFTSLLVNGVKQPASISMSGNQVVIEPTNSFPVCASVTVRLTGAAQNAYGVSGDSGYSYASRAHCYTTFSIGTSVQGRPITAYKFGNGPSMVLYIGAMEGNEQNSSELLSQWIPDVDANPGRIPSYRTLVITPTINPDGFAADTRLNTDGIDLNRNFPANNWQTKVTEPLANTVWTKDGGPYPLSAPESRALANYYKAHRPRLALTMHSHGGIVEANDAGDSIALGAQYASLAGYEAIPTYAIGNFFDYTTTGAFEDWANNKLHLPVLEVELESATSDEYSRNLPALWAMAQVSR